MYIIEQSHLVSLIMGGNRINSYSKSLSLKGKVKDPNLEPLRQLEGISYEWDCTLLSTNSECAFIDGKKAIFNSTSLE